MIIKALSEYLGASLPYEDLFQVRSRLADVAPHLLRHDIAEPVSKDIMNLAIAESLITPGIKPVNAQLKNPISNFYFTDVISRTSPTMAKCVSSFGAKVDKITDPNAHMNLGIA
ncbi:unnamed protein product [[Candida] boidinii]|nr:unnamed protein product [[Candida] boidinii]